MPRRTASTTAKLSVAEETFRLWQQLAAYPASRTDAALRHLLRWIAETVDADNVIWIGAVRALHGAAARSDAFRGWRLRLREPLHRDAASYRRRLAAYLFREHYGKLTPTYYDRSHAAHEEAHIGLAARALLAGAGRFQLHRLRDGWIDFPAFRRSLHYRIYYRDQRIADRIWIAVPVTADREAVFLIDRRQVPGAPRRRHFSRREAELPGDALRAIPWFHRRLLLDCGLLAGDKPLSPTERRVLRGLLTGRPEKDLAARLGQAPATLHHYVKALYRHFGVGGRAGLMALWLDGAAPPPV